MKKCPNCGKISDTSFCPDCGYDLRTVKSSVCPNCGLESDTNFCPNCGAPINAATSSTSIKDATKVSTVVASNESVNEDQTERTNEIPATAMADKEVKKSSFGKKFLAFAAIILLLVAAIMFDDTVSLKSFNFTGANSNESSFDNDPIIGTYHLDYALRFDGSYASETSTIEFKNDGTFNWKVNDTSYAGEWKSTDMTDSSIDTTRKGYSVIQRGEELNKAWFSSDSEFQVVIPLNYSCSGMYLFFSRM
jgi:hypothetical protein